MTDLQKNEMAILKNDGLTYREISERTGIGLSSVKAFFAKENAKPEEARKVTEFKNGCCRWCGKPLINTPGKRDKMFCNNACKQKKAYYDRKTRVLKRACVCPTCHKQFTTLRSSKQVYCSQKCYFDRDY